MKQFETKQDMLDHSEPGLPFILYGCFYHASVADLAIIGYTSDDIDQFTDHCAPTKAERKRFGDALETDLLVEMIRAEERFDKERALKRIATWRRQTGPGAFRSVRPQGA